MTADPVPPPPDAYANKAIAVAVLTVITVITQWLSTGEISLDLEGITALSGAVATLLVYLISNTTRKGL